MTAKAGKPPYLSQFVLQNPLGKVIVKLNFAVNFTDQEEKLCQK